MPTSDSLKVICEEDCGNAPKKEQLKQFNIAYAQNDIRFLAANVTDDISWNIIGDHCIQGKAQFIEAMQQMGDIQASELHIDNIITHGKTASLNGTILFGKDRYAICDVYEFNNASKSAKIKKITSYVIKLAK